MEILAKLFGSATRVKIMRLFLLNRTVLFNIEDIIKRSKTEAGSARKELKLLSSIDFIKQQKNGWIFNSAFKYLTEVEGILISADTLNKENLAKELKKIGQVKLIIIAGTFLKLDDSRADLLVVVDKVSKNKFQSIISKIESEIGKEITYVAFDTQEFFYRLNMYDKLIRDVLDFQHEVLFLSKEFSTISLKRT